MNPPAGTSGFALCLSERPGLAPAPMDFLPESRPPPTGRQASRLPGSWDSSAPGARRRRRPSTRVDPPETGGRSPGMALSRSPGRSQPRPRPWRGDLAPGRRGAAPRRAPSGQPPGGSVRATSSRHRRRLQSRALRVVVVPVRARTGQQNTLRQRSMVVEGKAW